MELVSLGMEFLQNIAEHAASYKPGQSLLRLLDRGLWVVEKCARWAVPPPLDQDERPQPELVRPLPWLFFLMMLVTLRIARESISLVNLIMGKPPLRSADVVMFIQSKRRYLRTLKYQGNRMMRARTSSQPQRPWYSGLHSLFELTMCFRRQSLNYGNNNTTSVTNNDEVVVIKRSKRVRPSETPEAPPATADSPMERLIEKMMVNLDAESDEDSSFTLTNATSPKSDRSDLTESDQDTVFNTSATSWSRDAEISETNGDDIHFSPNKKENSSTPEKTENNEKENQQNDTLQNSHSDNETTKTENSVSRNSDEKRQLEENVTETAYAGFSTDSNSVNQNSVDSKPVEDSALQPPEKKKIASPKQETENFIKHEATQNSRRTPKKDHKIANGRTVKSVPSKKKGNNHQEARISNEVHQQKVLPTNSSF